MAAGNTAAMTDERGAQRALMARKRAIARNIEILPVKKPARRRACSRSPEKFCRTYFPQLFYNPFTKDQKAIIAAITRQIKTGGHQAIAAERGGGKSTITKIVAGIWAILYGRIGYLLLIGANGPAAEDSLHDIKDFYEFNDTLAEDFPEVCIPIRCLEGAAQRAGGQTANNERTRIKWQDKEVVMPRVKVWGKLSAASGAINATRGIDSAIRGLVKAGKRPDLVICDDIETRASAQSLIETQKRKDTLESDVLGLSGPGRLMPVILLGTIIKRGCLIELFTDRKENPAWHGIRQKRIVKYPENEGLWAKYIELRQKDQLEGDMTARGAAAFYIEHRAEMDKGFEVSNPYRFEKVKLDDKKLKGQLRYLEISAQQSAYNDMADMTVDNFNSEYQNEPKEETAETAGLDVRLVQKKLNHIPLGVVPADALKVTAAIDMGRRELHWAVVAWKIGAMGYVIDYGTEDVHSPIGDLENEQVRAAQEQALLSSLLTWRDNHQQHGYNIEGTTKVRHIDLCLIDAGWFPDPVFQFCVASTSGVYKPAGGFGANSRLGHYRKGAKQTGGLHWNLSFHSGKKRGRYDLDADYYKMRVHDGIMTPLTERGSISLYGDEPMRHRSFAEQIMAEVWVRDFVAGKGWKEGFIVRHRRNHFLDCTAYNVAAAEMLGISLVADPRPRVQLNQSAREKMARPKMAIRTKY